MKGKPGNKPPAKDFKHNPFKNLKGLPVDSVVGPAPTAAPLPPPKASIPEDRDAPDLFSAEMERLGVQRQTGAQDRPLLPSKPPVEDDPTGPCDDETSLFLEALGRLDSPFQDHLPEADEIVPPRALPRRMRQLEQGRMAPESQLDLHGMIRAQALERVRWFLKDAVFQGLRTVLIVTGQGRNSPQGPVLREAVCSYLAGGGEGLVGEWGMAPARYGGAGAIVVFLRGSEGRTVDEPGR